MIMDRNNETKGQKIVRYIKVAILHLLILATAGSAIYAHSVKWVADKEAEVKEAKIQSLQEELNHLKAQN